MSYIGIYRALYDHQPQSVVTSQGDTELVIKAGDLLYIVEKDVDANWWKARKRATNEDDDEPEGLVPKNYIQEVEPIGKARALYEYTRQTEEELSFEEGAVLDVFDVSEPDWTLVGLNGDFGFAPSNYIDFEPINNDQNSSNGPLIATSPPQCPASDTAHHLSTQEDIPLYAPQVVKAIATEGVTIQSAQSPMPRLTNDREDTSPPSLSQHRVENSHREDLDPNQVQGPLNPRHLDDVNGREENEIIHVNQGDDKIASHSNKIIRDANVNRTIATRPRMDNNRESMIQASPSAEHMRVQGGFHLYNINEMVSLLGKKKKMPSTLGINIATRTILIAPERASDGSPQEWSADKMTHHSREGKHVFLELIRPSRSVDFHAGAKDTAEEIVSALEELAGIIRADGLRDAIMNTDTNHKMGVVLYDFVAQGDDEVTVGVGDKVIVLDDSKSQEWWSVRRVKTGNDGVIPSSYIEVIGSNSPRTPSIPVKFAADAIRPEEKRILLKDEHGGSSKKQRSKPDSSRLRQWTDRSKSFSVEAQFLGLKDNKVNLHKTNGVKIAVPLAKMSFEDLEYIENLTGISIAEKGDIGSASGNRQASVPSIETTTKIGISVEPNHKPEYDWFQFFLSCEVAVGSCDRYAQAFIRDSMDESVLPDVDASVLRTLGLREGDIIKVMRVLEAKFGSATKSNVSGHGGNIPNVDINAIGLFSGPGGTLRNNTKKGRPIPTVQTSSVVDSNVFAATSPGGNNSEATSESGHSPGDTITTSASPNTVAPATRVGFEDDAWDVKPPRYSQSKLQQSVQPNDMNSSPKQTSGDDSHATSTSVSMKELTLLTEPLQPTKPDKPYQSNSIPISSQTNFALPPTNIVANAAPLGGASPRGIDPLDPHDVLSARQNPLVSQATIIPEPPIPLPFQRPLSAPHSAQTSTVAPPITAHVTGHSQSYVAPPGHSLNDLGRLQYQPSLLSQLPPYGISPVNHSNQLPIQLHHPMPPMASFSPSVQPPHVGAGVGFPASINQLQTFQRPLQPLVTGGINSYLPTPMEPDRVRALDTTSYSSDTVTSNINLQPLQPQKTGPPPDVRFGLNLEPKRLVPNPTGRRANLSQATPDNPFGF